MFITLWSLEVLLFFVILQKYVLGIVTCIQKCMHRKGHYVTRRKKGNKENI